MLESETLWKIFLQADFGINADNSSIYQWNQSINVASNPDPGALSIFGIDPTKDNFLLEISATSTSIVNYPASFAVWKQWLKISKQVFKGKDIKEIWSRKKSQYTSFSQSFLNLNASSSYQSNMMQPPILMAPYFLRAAKFWRTFLLWCDSDDIAKDVGKRIRDSLAEAKIETLRNKMDQIGTLDNDEVPMNYACRMVLLAIYSFTSGQNSSCPFDGMLGAYHAYGVYFCMFLTNPFNMQSSRMCVAQDLIAHAQGMDRYICMNYTTGGLFWEPSPGSENVVLLDKPSQRSSFSARREPRPDDFLTWLEEYAQRLTNGVYRVDVQGSEARDPTAISLFPTLPYSAHQNETIESVSESAAVVSRAVTRGVEVVASAVYAPQGRNRFSFVYCFRIRLLTPGEDGYMSEDERGFQSCQLLSRHWRIKDYKTGNVDSVNGNGVIGLYPILCEGGFKERSLANSLEEGVFKYQSCSGEMPEGGCFEGHIQFVPGCLDIPSGPDFSVKVNPFELNPRPTFMY